MEWRVDMSRWKARKKRSLQRDLEFLLSDLCVEWGFCIPPVYAVKIAQSKELDGDEFAKAVLIAEGMNLEYEKQWYRRIRSRFETKFGLAVAAHAYNEEL